MKQYKKKRPWIGKTRFTKELENIVNNYTEIICAEVKNKHVYFSMKDEKKCRKIRGRMMDIAVLLTDEMFLHPHEAFIINMKRVLDFDILGEGLLAILEEDNKAIVTKKMKPIFIIAFKKYKTNQDDSPADLRG